MADEKNKDQNQGSERNEKAMGATATGGAQGQQPNKPEQQGQSQPNFGRGQQESAGQGGGIQGQGQRNPNQAQDKGEQRGEDFRPGTGGGARQGDGDV